MDKIQCWLDSWFQNFNEIRNTTKICFGRANIYKFTYSKKMWVYQNPWKFTSIYINGTTILHIRWNLLYILVFMINKLKLYSSNLPYFGDWIILPIDWVHPSTADDEVGVQGVVSKYWDTDSWSNNWDNLWSWLDRAVVSARLFSDNQSVSEKSATVWK